MESKLLKNTPLVHRYTDNRLNFRAETMGGRVAVNIEKILKEMKIEPKKIFTGRQKHTANIKCIHEDTIGEDFYYGEIFTKTDGFITDLEDVALVVKVADCAPVLLYDPILRVQANVHAGWRGTVKRITTKAIELMEQNYGCKRENILAYSGPSIGPKDFEIMDDVKTIWEKNFNFAQDVIGQKDSKHYLLDLKETHRRLFLEDGILESHIEISPISTVSSPNLHSYRREQPNYGLNAMISMIDSRK